MDKTPKTVAVIGASSDRKKFGNRALRAYVAQARRGGSEAHERYFRERLGDVTEPTAAFGLLDGVGQGTPIEVAREPLPDPLAGRLRACARALEVTPASLFHVAWAAVLARVSGRADVVFGTVLFGRMDAGVAADRALGLFHESLTNRGFLGLGSKETLDFSAYADRFEPVSRPDRLYRRKPEAG